MADIRSGYSNYIQYVLKSEFSASILIEEPLGWDDDDFELNRDKKYHGIFTEFSGELRFTNEAMDYIEQAYLIGGINTNCRISKYELIDHDGDVKWKERYSALADYKTKTIKDGVLSIKFDSNNLAEILKSHENAEFEIERFDSIDGIELEPLELSTTEIKGRKIVTFGEAEWLNNSYASEFTGVNSATPFTKILSQGADRHSPVLSHAYDDDADLTSENCIYVESTDPSLNTAKVRIDYDINFTMTEVTFWWRFDLVKVRWNESLAIFEETDIKILEGNEEFPGRTEERNGIAGMNQYVEYTGTWEVDVEWNEAILFRWKFGGTNWRINFYEGTGYRRRFYKINEVTYWDASPALSTLFVSDLAERLMYIMTGKKNIFYSKYFGRIEKGYIEDGYGGLIAVISGYWLRAFDRTTEKYKSLTISFQDLFDSVNAVFNIGVGIESTVLGERVRFEDLRYFYQPEVVVKLKGAISKWTITADPDLFFSGLNFGYENTGEYENDNGLDEPNTETEWITPIRKSTNKYTRKSKIRADELAMELTRRKPQKLYPEEDTNRDDNNWFLDLKRPTPAGSGYVQSEWDDRLDEFPTGIFEAQTWHGFLFTPFRMMLRHSWIFRSGLEPYLGKMIKFINSKGNANLSMKFKDEILHSEKGDVFVRDVMRSKMLPEKIEFEFPVDDELMDLILSTTPKIINSELENVPNYYFKFEWQRNGITERGYLLNLKPKGNGKWTFQRANENLI